MHRQRVLVVGAVLLLLACIPGMPALHAQPSRTDSPQTQPSRSDSAQTNNQSAPHSFSIEVGPEYLWPTDTDREITTASLDVLIGREFIPAIGLRLFGGVTATFATGHIVQPDGASGAVRLNNTAAGIGPVFRIRLAPIRLGPIEPSFDGSGGIILYSGRFPAGGDFYNFMWRIGPSFMYSINDNFEIIGAFEWMHVSNGQGLGPFNPAYEAKGVALHVTRKF